jgi:hypothetical protein
LFPVLNERLKSRFVRILCGEDSKDGADSWAKTPLLKLKEKGEYISLHI